MKGDLKILGEADLKFLKAKCNALIDEALRLQEENRRKEEKIRQLGEKKKYLESRIHAEIPAPKEDREETKILNPIPNQYPIPVSEPAAEQYQGEHELISQNLINFTVSNEKIFEMIQSLNAVMDSRPREEFVIRNVSTGAKIIELFQDICGKLVKLLLLGMGMLVLSLVATILLNGELRNMIFEFIRSCIT